MLLAENQISKLENIYKYISKANLMNIILKFIELAYQNGEFNNLYNILRILISSNKNE